MMGCDGVCVWGGRLRGGENGNRGGLINEKYVSFKPSLIKYVHLDSMVLFVYVNL